MKRCSTSLVIGEMQIKTRTRYDLTPIRRTPIKKTESNCWQGCGEIKTLVHSWWECKIVQLLQKTVWQFPKKLKIEFPSDPAIPLLVIYPKELEATLKVIFVQTCLQQHHLHQLKRGRNRVHQQMSGEQNMIYSHKGILFSLKQEGIYDICYNIDIMLIEISQSQKYKYNNSTYMRYLEKWNEW